jgi:hypothetical protein
LGVVAVNGRATGGVIAVITSRFLVTYPRKGL